MAKGMAGADSSVVVTHTISSKTLVELATEHFEQVPVLWGRYFKSIHNTGGAEYRHRQENQILRDNGIRVLPTAQQTTHVNQGRQLGIDDAKLNVEDLIVSFGADYLATQGSEFLMFLDVEPSHPLSLDYYTGWAQTVISESLTLSGNRFKVLPAVYGNHSDNTTWHAIARASQRGVECHGVWVARYGTRPGCTKLIEWDNAEVMPAVTLPCQVLLWQYSEECHGGEGFDCNETNPNIDLQGDLLQKLILPSDVVG